MTKRLTRTEKAHRAKVRKMERGIVAKGKAEVNAKKKAGGLSRSERADMNAAVAYIKQTNYSSADDVCKNVKRLRTYSRACEAVANAEERGLVRGHRHPSAPAHEKTRYYPAGGKAPAKAKKKPVAKAKKAVANMDEQAVVDMEIVVRTIHNSGPMDFATLVKSRGDMPEHVIRKAVENARKLNLLGATIDTLYVAKPGAAHKKAPAKPKRLTHAQKAEAELLRCNEELAACREELKEADEASQAQHRKVLELRDALRRSDGIFTARIAGLGLRAKVQEATLKSEGHDFAVLCGRLRDLTEIVRTELRSVSVHIMDGRIKEPLRVSPEAREVNQVWSRWRSEREDALIRVYSDLKVLPDEFDPPGHWGRAARDGELTTAAVASIMGQADINVRSGAMREEEEDLLERLSDKLVTKNRAARAAKKEDGDGE